VALFTWLPSSPTPGPTFRYEKASLFISTGRSLRPCNAFPRSEDRFPALQLSPRGSWV